MLLLVHVLHVVRSDLALSHWHIRLAQYHLVIQPPQVSTISLWPKLDVSCAGLISETNWIDTMLFCWFCFYFFKKPLLYSVFLSLLMLFTCQKLFSFESFVWKPKWTFVSINFERIYCILIHKSNWIRWRVWTWSVRLAGSLVGFFDAVYSYNVCTNIHVLCCFFFGSASVFCRYCLYVCCCCLIVFFKFSNPYSTLRFSVCWCLSFFLQKW